MVVREEPGRMVPEFYNPAVLGKVVFHTLLCHPLDVVKARKDGADVIELLNELFVRKKKVQSTTECL